MAVDTLGFKDIAFELSVLDCGNNRERRDGAGDESDHTCQHPNITSYSGALCDERHAALGHIRIHLLNKREMDSQGINRMWEESRAYDAVHRGMMGSVENFISNEEFPCNREGNFAEAHSIVFIEEVCIIPERRGHDLGLHAVCMALIKVGVGQNAVVLLQAGSVGECPTSISKASERLTAHWMRLGFEAWSPSDDAWLCLSLQDEKFGLEVMHRRTTGPDIKSSKAAALS
ncbi:unnamed protein product [Zymoseptoria tritici ST99CH_1E4]|uniref:N-acetyltransferase domain-containing protein n=1 Tax=Zymoseptoria tritici ST99CH_1E4 TaxID=1276532 RepID=A0A2H1G5Y1_ZYMTR|nr:unnamed protein product [Zymoseptoria tritici ST99CH_1E4]